MSTIEPTPLKVLLMKWLLIIAGAFCVALKHKYFREFDFYSSRNAAREPVMDTLRPAFCVSKQSR